MQASASRPAAGAAPRPVGTRGTAHRSFGTRCVATVDRDAAHRFSHRRSRTVPRQPRSPLTLSTGPLAVGPHLRREATWRLRSPTCENEWCAVEAANTRRSVCYDPRPMALRTRVVSFTDHRGARHTVEVSADSLYEAAALGLRALSECDWIEPIGASAHCEVEAKQVATSARNHHRRLDAGASRQPLLQTSECAGTR